MGEVSVGSWKTGSLVIRNVSELPASVLLRAQSKTLSVPDRPVTIASRETAHVKKFYELARF